MNDPEVVANVIRGGHLTALNIEDSGLAIDDGLVSAFKYGSRLRKLSASRVRHGLSYANTL